MKTALENLYEMDYVYVPKGTELFKSVNIILKINHDKLELFVSSDELIHDEDLAIILKSLQKNQFDKMHINLADDVTINITMENKKYTALFQDLDLKTLSLHLS